MVRDSFLLFDDYVQTGGAVYSDRTQAARLGLYDQLALQAILDEAQGTGTASIWIEHSADGVFWIAKSATHEINAVSVQAGQTNAFYGCNDQTPMLPILRIAVNVGAAVVSAHVKIYVVQRDTSD